jgi:hypothetical protein
MCGAKALHVLEHLYHPLLICQAGLPVCLPLRYLRRLHLCRSLLSSSSWACNIPIQYYNNSKRRYTTQGMMSYRSTNLELLYVMM